MSSVPLSPRQQQLVLEAMPMIQLVAGVLSRRTGASFDELQAAGHEAAVRGALRFDEEMGVAFSVFVLKRVKGAMLDVAFANARETRAFLKRGYELVRGGDHEATFDATEHELGPVESHMTDILLGAALPSGTTVEEHGWRAHLKATLTHALAELAEPEKALARAFYWEELTIDQVAEKLNMSRATTRRTHDRVKAKLLRGMRRRDVVAP